MARLLRNRKCKQIVAMATTSGSYGKSLKFPTHKTTIIGNELQTTVNIKHKQ